MSNPGKNEACGIHPYSRVVHNVRQLPLKTFRCQRTITKKCEHPAYGLAVCLSQLQRREVDLQSHATDLADEPVDAGGGVLVSIDSKWSSSLLEQPHTQTHEMLILHSAR